MRSFVSILLHLLGTNKVIFHFDYYHIRFMTLVCERRLIRLVQNTYSDTILKM